MNLQCRQALEVEKDRLGSRLDERSIPRPVERHLEPGGGPILRSGYHPPQSVGSGPRSMPLDRRPRLPSSTQVERLTRK